MPEECPPGILVNKLKNFTALVLSPEMVSKITDRIAPEIKEWQQRPLEPIYTFVFMDEIH